MAGCSGQHSAGDLWAHSKGLPLVDVIRDPISIRYLDFGDLENVFSGTVLDYRIMAAAARQIIKELAVGLCCLIHSLHLIKPL